MSYSHSAADGRLVMHAGAAVIRPDRQIQRGIFRGPHTQPSEIAWYGLRLVELAPLPQRLLSCADIDHWELIKPNTIGKGASHSALRFRTLINIPQLLCLGLRCAVRS